MNSKLWLVAYDIANKKRLKKVFNLMKRYGTPVQYSLFECYLSAKQERLLLNELSTIVSISDDKVHFFPLCGQCHSRIKQLGCAEKLKRPPDVWIVR